MYPLFFCLKRFGILQNILFKNELRFAHTLSQKCTAVASVEYTSPTVFRRFLQGSLLIYHSYPYFIPPKLGKLLLS